MSDYDFAILYTDSAAPSAQKRSALVHELAQLLGTERVDLVVLNQSPVELQYSVIVTGTLLYEGSRTARVEFEARTLGRYFDYLPVLRRQRRELLDEEAGDYETGIQRYREALSKTEELLTQARTA